MSSEQYVCSENKIDNEFPTKKYVEKIISFRKNSNIKNINMPRYVESDRYKYKNNMYTRLRIILRSNGCSVPTCTMCPFPNEGVDKNVLQVKSEQYINQIRHTLLNYSHHDILSIYNDGNFFSDRELPNEARQEIYQLANNFSCKYLMVESLPNFITEQKIKEAVDLLNPRIQLIVGTGFESASKEVRDICIKTPLKEKAFLEANKLLNKCGYDLKTYVLIKPPFFLENDVIPDVLASTIWLHNNGISDITLCPMRVVPGTVLQDLFEKGLYQPPKLTTVARVLQTIQNHNIQVRISIFNVNSSDLDAITVSGCKQCNLNIIPAMHEYNEMKQINFSNFFCNICEQKAEQDDPEIFKGLTFRERVQKWLSQKD